LLTSSFGLGQLLAHARDTSAGLVVLGLGGTSTVDLGLGMAQALGIRLPGVPEPAGGAALASVTDIEPDPAKHLRERMKLVVACDVKNPLVGERGAARAFAAQKGASPATVLWLERELYRYARILNHACRDTEVGANTCAAVLPFDCAVAAAGTGAAGGIAFALQQLLDAKLLPGIELVMKSVGFEERLSQADCVITGEGRLDRSSFEGKVVSAVVGRAHAKGIPVCAVCGSSEFSAPEARARGIAELETLSAHALDLEDSRQRTRELLRAAGERLAVNASSWRAR
jgi:glycerate kinase